MFCVYKTDPNWINTLRELDPDTQVNFWRKGTNALKLPLGSWFYFNQRRTRHIVGRGVLVGYEIMPIENAWQFYGVGNGVSSLAELRERATEILDVTSQNSEIGCILLSELQFLAPGNEYTISTEDYAPEIVGPKYFKDSDLPDLHAKFTSVFAPSQLGTREVTPPSYIEGVEKYSYRRGFERNADARKACLDRHDFTCKACGVLMENVYGAIARGLIHVHHINPIAFSQGAREVDPIVDLVPLCPNCHTIAHRRVPPFSVEEIVAFIRSKNGTRLKGDDSE